MESSPKMEAVPLAASESPSHSAANDEDPVKPDASSSCSANGKTECGKESSNNILDGSEEVVSTESAKPKDIPESSKEQSEKDEGNTLNEVSQEVEPMSLDTSDANNTSNETFCSNASSSVIIGDVKDVQVIAESDNEEDQEELSEDVRSLGRCKSPDMFATQPPDDEPITEDLQNSTGVIDCEDFIPSSQSIESSAHGLESFKSDKKDDNCSPLSRKRKLVEGCEVEKKLPRIEETEQEPVAQTSEPPPDKQPNTCPENATPKKESVGNKIEVSGETVTAGNSNENIPANEDSPLEKKKNEKTEDNSTNIEKMDNTSNLIKEPPAVAVKNVEPEIAEQCSINKADIKEPHKRQARDSLMIVYESPRVSQSLETQDFDRLVSPLQNEDKLSPSKEVEDNFHLYLSPPESPEKETISRKNCDSQPFTPSQRTTSMKSGSSEHSWNSHNSVGSVGVSEHSTNRVSESGPKKSAEVLTLDEDDDDLQILPVKQKAAEEIESRSDSVSSACNGNSSVPVESNMSSNDIAVIGECKSDTTSVQGKKQSVLSSSNSTSKSDTLSLLIEEKDCNFNSSSDVLQVQAARDVQSTNMKRKRDSPRNCDVIRIGSDSESEDHPEQLAAKKLRDQNSPEDIHIKHLTKINLSDNSGPSMEMDKKIYFECRVRVKCDSANHDIQFWEVTQWDDVTDDLQPPTSTHMVCDSSSGADVSKSSSPASVTSFGQFPLKPRHRFSTSTTSSDRTSNSGLSSGSHPRSFENIPFAHPSKPAVRGLKDKSFSYLGRLKELELQEKIERRLQQIVRYEGEMGEKIELRDVSPRNGFNQLDGEKISVEWKSTNGSIPLEKSEISSSERKTDEKDIHEAMDIQTTSKSSKKSNPRSTRPNRNASKVSGAKTSQESDTGKKRGTRDPGNSNTVGGTARKKGRSRKAGDSVKKSGGNSKVELSESSSKRNKSGTTDEDSSKLRRGRNNPGGDSVSSESEVTSNWDVEKCKTELLPGAAAFARWTDKKYYSGKIKEKIKDDRWVVEFDDGNVKTMKEEFIIPVNILTKGIVVFASVKDDYEEGRIIQFKVLNDEIWYGIEMNGDEILFMPRSKLFMTEDQARILQEDVAPKLSVITPKSTSVSVENIVEGKRSRSHRALFRTTEGPGVSGLAKTIPKRASNTSCSSPVSDITDKGSASAFEEVTGVDPEVPNSPDYSFSFKTRGKGPGRIKGQARTAKRVPSSRGDSENSELVESLGPIPEEGSKLFNGMHFLITYAGISPSQSSQVSTGSETEGEDKEFCNPPLVREHLKHQLEAGGGKVYEYFEDVPTNVYSSCYLIADRPTHTAKYLLCLAYGIRIISSSWVVSMCKGKVLDLLAFHLPTGWSIEKQEFIDWDNRSKKRKPLSKQEVGLVNESKHFIEFWEQVLVALGAKVRKISSEKDRDFSSVRVIVTDSSCPPEVRDRACEWNIPMVSTTWVKQCLIKWEALKYDGHNFYRYDYCPSD